MLNEFDVWSIRSFGELLFNYELLDSLQEENQDRGYARTYKPK
jgi:hypothetical protein